MDWLGWLLLSALLLLCSSTPASAAGLNLLPNGSFEKTPDPLIGWQYKFEQQGESWYFDNHKSVSVVKLESGHQNVLRLNVPSDFIAQNQGVKVESDPVPIKPGGRYRLSGFAKSTGPDLRLMCEGYKWRPNVTPHEHPTIYELRKTYRGSLVFFGRDKSGTVGGLVAGGPWKHGETEFPQSVDTMKTLQNKLFNEVQFLVVHVIAINGAAGDVFVDDLQLERIN